jgi:hypothetical protein
MAVAVTVIKIKRIIVIVVVAAAIYKLVYSYSSLYSTNTYQYAHLLKPKSHMEAVQFSIEKGIKE